MHKVKSIKLRHQPDIKDCKPAKPN